MNLMLSWSTHLETKWFNQMHYLGDQISAQKKTMTMKTLLLRLQTIKAIVDSRSFKSPKSEEPRRVQVLDLYCLTRFESEGSSKGIVY